MIYAIGDIHGQLRPLQRALALIEADGGPDAEVVFLGDFVDRGPASAGVLDLLIEGQAAGRRWTAIKGNHDRMMQWFVETTPRLDPHLYHGLHWLHPRLGGDATLVSYGVAVNPDRRQGAIHADARDAVPERHLAFLRGLPLMHRAAGLTFVHAGIRPGVGLDHQIEADLLWIRDGWLDDPRDHGTLVVHGHTALGHPAHHGNRVNLDGGAGYGRPLVPAVFEGGRAWTLTGDGREPLAPH